ncbi:MAG: Aldo/keto reductase [Benniella sp.]|nr:MAG: Aldo/keto reductase [Benniella sp.]
MTASSTDANIPRIVLGTMSFGLEDTPAEGTVVRVRGAEKVGPFLETFHSFGHVEIDTARIYGNGDTEMVLSQLPTAHLKISTKVFPAHPGAFNMEHLGKQFQGALEALKATKVDILYLHAPEPDTPIEVTLQAINTLYQDGLFDRFGLSNYPSWNVALIYELCKEKGYVLPTVYQGMYNPIARGVVPELLPCLRYYNIGFYAFNTAGGGLLTGNYKFEQEDITEGSRYDPHLSSGKRFRERYWHKLNFEGVEILKKAAEANGMTVLEASMRWMRHHSGLEAKDGIILGASNQKHLEQTLKDLEKGPLSQPMIDAFEEAWECVKPVASNFFRYPGEKRPNWNSNNNNDNKDADKDVTKKD